MAVELWDLYDAHGNLTGKTMVRGEEVPFGCYHLAVHIWPMNSRGEFLIQRRSPNVQWKPNLWAVTGGSAISGDPGALQEYPFSIVIDVPANEGTDILTRQIIVTDEGGHQDVCLLTLAAGDAYITVTAGDIELDYLGTPVAVFVESNTTWTVE